MAKTIGQYHQEAAKKYHQEKQALMNVLRQRITWHNQQLEQTENAAEQEAHLGMIEQDEDAVEKIQHLYAKRKAFYKRQNITLEDLK